MNLESLYELETIVDDLAQLTMSRKQQKRVLKLRHQMGVVSGYCIEGLMAKSDQQRCQQALVKIRTLSLIGFSNGKTKEIRSRFADITEIVGYLESQLNHQIQHPRFTDRIRDFLRIAISWLF